MRARQSEWEWKLHEFSSAEHLFVLIYWGTKNIIRPHTRHRRPQDRNKNTRAHSRTISIPWLNVSHSMLITSFNCKWQNTILFAMLYETISQKIGLFQRVSYASTHKSMRASKWKPDYRRLWCGGDDDHELIIIFSVLLTGLFVVGNFSN